MQVTSFCVSGISSNYTALLSESRGLPKGSFNVRVLSLVGWSPVAVQRKGTLSLSLSLSQIDFNPSPIIKIAKDHNCLLKVECECVLIFTRREQELQFTTRHHQQNQVRIRGHSPPVDESLTLTLSPSFRMTYRI